MDLSFLHPKLVHIPIALAVLMPLIAGSLTLALWRGWLPKRTWAVAVALQVVLVVTGFAAMKTGEADGERVEQVVSEAYVEAHEEAAEVFTWASLVVLLPVALTLVARRPKVALLSATVATVGTLVVLGLGVRVGEAGGNLVYRHNAAAVYASDVPGGPAYRPEAGDSDDD